MTRAGERRCPFSGKPADELHHVTGRVRGRYADPDLVIPLTRSEHALEHTCWRAAGIGEGAHVEPVVVRLRRIGHLLVRLAEHHVGGVIELPDFTVRELGLLLLRVSDEIDAPR